MTRQEILSKIGDNKKALKGFGVKTLSLFGSLARDEATESSDIDLLVVFDKPVGLFRFVRLKRFLEQLLGRPVDLTTPDALKQQLRDQILKEAIRAA